MSYSVNELKEELVKTLRADYGYDADDATILQMYGAVLTVVRQKLLDKRGGTCLLKASRGMEFEKLFKEI